MKTTIYLLAILLAVLPVDSPAPAALRQAADSANVLVGTAVRPSQFSEAAYSETLGHEFNMVEAEDAMKWRALRPNAESFDFDSGDEIVRFAKAHGMKVRGHCLAWAQYNPEWLAHGTFTPAQLNEMLHTHISTVMKHYSGDVFAWDVVNEALDDHGEAKDSIWYNHPGIGLAGKGTAYVEQAFRWAREAEPGALLFYNEAGGEGLNRKSDAVYAMVKSFKKHGVPIDGVGLQLHISSLDYNVGDVAGNIARLTKLGVQVHITELDVSVPVDAHGEGVNHDDLQRQAEIYRDVVRACLQSAGCTAIQTWGFTDKYSWIGWFTHGARGDALPFDRAYHPKPAYAAFLGELTAGRSRKR
jgi:endo-1,4-beta-xylanase